MAKKDFGSIASMLAPIASTLPSQNVAPPRAPPVPDPPMTSPAVASPTPQAAPVAVQDVIVKQTFELRKAQRQQLELLAREEGLTTRAFILQALKAKKLEVTDEDLADKRSTRHAKAAIRGGSSRSEAG